MADLLCHRSFLSCKDNTLKVCMVTHTHSKSIDQPGKVASPARGQLNRENEYFPVRVCAREFGLARRGRQCPAPRQPAHVQTQAESGAYFRVSSRFPRRRVNEQYIHTVVAVPTRYIEFLLESIRECALQHKKDTFPRDVVDARKVPMRS